MSETRDCVDCRYEHLWSFSIPCNTCLNTAEKPNFKPKQEETMAEERVPAMGATMPRQESATDAVAKIMDYSHPLYEAFDDAVKQQTHGKGQRHGGAVIPFLEQPIMQISKHTGVGGLIFQMVKKAQEACGKDDQEAFERELLGALVYGGAAYLYVKQHGFKK